MHRKFATTGIQQNHQNSILQYFMRLSDRRESFLSAFLSQFIKLREMKKNELFTIHQHSVIIADACLLGTCILPAGQYLFMLVAPLS
jgi:hypothetical protein